MESTLNLILQELKNVNVRLGALEQGQKALEQGQKTLEQRQINLEQGQKEIRFDLAELKENHLVLKQDLVDNFSKFNNNLENFVEEKIDLLHNHIGDKTSALNKA